VSRHARRIDDNQAEIVEALRRVGASVQSIAKVGAGCPDLLVGYRRRTFLLEVKDGKKPLSARKLTPLETKWQRMWTGWPVEIVNSVEEALFAIGALGGPGPHNENW
jgi:hypothetical protein